MSRKDKFLDKAVDVIGTAVIHKFIKWIFGESTKIPEYKSEDKPREINPQPVSPPTPKPLSFKEANEPTEVEELPKDEFEVDFSDGAGGYLYKPEGENSKQPVILLKEGVVAKKVFLRNIRKGNTYHFIVSPSGAFSNGSRNTWRAKHDRKRIRELLGEGPLEIVVVRNDGARDGYEIRGLKQRRD